jgi:branched-chain amino acid transport system substrate-binding protein
MKERDCFAKILFTIGVTILVISFPICRQWTANAQSEIKIGVLAPLTGPAAETGVYMKNTGIMWEEEINKGGGILGRKIKLFYADDESKPAAGVSAIERLITKDRVEIVTGLLNSDVGLATMEVAARYGLPFCMTGPTSEGITEKIRKNPKKFWCIFKDTPSTLYYGISWAEFNKHLVENNLFRPKNNAFAIIAENTDYGRTSANAFKRDMGAYGWKEVALELVDIKHADFYAQLNKIKAVKPDVLWTIQTSAAAGVALFKQFLEVGIPAVYEACYVASKPDFMKLTGKDAVGVLSMNNIGFVPGLSDQFLKRYAKAWGHEPDTLGPIQWQVLTLIKMAIEKAGSTDPHKFVEAYLKSDYTGPVGRTVFTENHEAKGGSDYIPQIVTQIREEAGKFVHVVIYPKKYAAHEFKIPPWIK